MKCAVCEREVFGFWKHKFLLDPVCSRKCLRTLIAKEGWLRFGDKETPSEYLGLFSRRHYDSPVRSN
jgi:hypothetical protein